MDHKSSIFLTLEEAIDAICFDFRQYDPQMMLFAEVLPLLTDNRLHLKREAGKNGAWINRVGRSKMQWLTGPELISFMCQSVRNANWDIDLLASVSQRVFQSRVRPEVDPVSGETGIRIETNMETFQCRQCGRCCRALDYHHELTDEDVTQWNATGHDEILKWVAVADRDNGRPAYRIWVSPDTGQLVTPCPFLKKEPASNRWQCGIHDIKPTICRQYPVSRKHALLTGCSGFIGTSRIKGKP